MYSCPSSILLRINKPKSALYISEAELYHNHQCFDITDNLYITKKKLNLEESKAVSLLTYLHATPKCIQNFILKSFENNDKEVLSMQSKDVISFFEEFLAMNPLCDIKIIEHEQVLTAVYLQTTEMKNKISEFKGRIIQMISINIPESVYTAICVVGVDSDLHTPLLSILITNTSNFTNKVIHDFIEMFVEENQQFCDIFLGIVTNFCQETVDFLQILMPHTYIAWSRSFILQHFKEISQHAESTIEMPFSYLEELLISENEKDYNDRLKTFLALADPQLAKDFLEKWDSYKSMWVQYEIASFPGFLPPKSVNESILKQLTHFRESGRSFSLINIIKFLTEITNQEDLNKIECASPTKEIKSNKYNMWYRSLCPTHIADVILGQIAISANSNYIIFGLSGGPTSVRRWDNEEEIFRINKEVTKCTCFFHKTTDLPCEHIFNLRAHQQLPFCDEALIPLTWNSTAAKSLILPLLNKDSLNSFVPSAAMYDKRMETIQNVTKDILLTCGSHSFSELGKDLTLLKKMLTKLKTKAYAKKDEELLLSNEHRQKTKKSNRMTGIILKGADLEPTSSLSEELASNSNTQPNPPSSHCHQSFSTEKRHNLRRNIKHKFIHRDMDSPSSILRPVVKKKGKYFSEQGRSCNKRKLAIVEDVEVPATKRNLKDQLTLLKDGQEVDECHAMTSSMIMASGDTDKYSISSYEDLSSKEMQEMPVGYMECESELTLPSSDKLTTVSRRSHSESIICQGENENESERPDEDEAVHGALKRNEQSEMQFSCTEDSAPRPYDYKGFDAFLNRLPSDEINLLMQNVLEFEIPERMLDRPTEITLCRQNPVHHLFESLDKETEVSFDSE